MTSTKTKIFVNDLSNAHQILAQEVLGYIQGHVGGQLTLALNKETGEIHYYHMWNNSWTPEDITNIDLNFCLSDIVEGLEYNENDEICAIHGEEYSEKELYENADEWLPDIYDKLKIVEEVYESIWEAKNKHNKNLTFKDDALRCDKCGSSVIPLQDYECSCDETETEEEEQ